MAATKEQIRQAAMEMHGWMQQRAIARLQGDLPARSQSKVGVRSGGAGGDAAPLPTVHP